MKKNIIKFLFFSFIILSVSFILQQRIVLGNVGDPCWAPVCTDGHYCPPPHQACYTSVCHLVQCGTMDFETNCVNSIFTYCNTHPEIVNCVVRNIGSCPIVCPATCANQCGSADLGEDCCNCSSCGGGPTTTSEPPSYDCYVGLSASPNPIPEGQNKTKLCFSGASLNLNTCVMKRQSDGVTIPYSTEKNIAGQFVTCGWSTQVQPTETYTVKCNCAANAPPEGYVTASVIVRKLKGYCSVTATADPNPIPEGQNQTTISAKDLSYTSLDKCRVGRKYAGDMGSGGTSYSLPHTYTQDINSEIYVVKCTGDTEYGDCQSEVTVTKGNVPPTIPPTVPPTIPPPPTCQIFEFSINDKTNEDQNPLIVWVNAFLKGYFSVNDACKTCTVSSDDTWGNPPQSYPISTLKSSYTESFKITTAGTYAYTLECKGTDPEDIALDTLSLQTVKALNLPWWREIIPNLLPFLRGMIR